MTLSLVRFRIQRSLRLALPIIAISSYCIANAAVGHAALFVPQRTLGSEFLSRTSYLGVATSEPWWLTLDEVARVDVSSQQAVDAAEEAEEPTVAPSDDNATESNPAPAKWRKLFFDLLVNLTGPSQATLDARQIKECPDIAELKQAVMAQDDWDLYCELSIPSHILISGPDQNGLVADAAPAPSDAVSNDELFSISDWWTAISQNDAVQFTVELTESAMRGIAAEPLRLARAVPAAINYGDSESLSLAMDQQWFGNPADALAVDDYAADDLAYEASNDNDEAADAKEVATDLAPNAPVGNNAADDDTAEIDNADSAPQSSALEISALLPSLHELDAILAIEPASIFQLPMSALLGPQFSGLCINELENLTHANRAAANRAAPGNIQNLVLISRPVLRSMADALDQAADSLKVFSRRIDAAAGPAVASEIQPQSSRAADSAEDIAPNVLRPAAATAADADASGADSSEDEDTLD